MKIVGICGSPRKGNSEFMLKTLLNNARRAGAKVDLILLRNLNISFIGKKKTDDFKKILPKIIKADAIVLATPVYYDMISPQLLNLIDKLDTYADFLKNKKLGVILCGTAKFESSGKNALEYLKRVAEIYEMKFIGFVFGRAEKAGEISKNSKVISRLKKFGKKLAIF
jgi:multimeric flavodoxin WrbA